MGELGNNFYLEEMFTSRDFPDLAKSSYDKEHDNKELIEKGKHLVMQCAQPTRNYINKKIEVLSWYRDQFLNKAVGGVPESDHTIGLAMDFTADYDLYQLYKWMVDNICYRQLIYYPEQNFIHVSVNWFDRDYRHNPLVKYEGKYISPKDYYISKG